MRKKTNTFTALFKPIAMLLVLILLLTATSYAWIKRNWQPTIEEKELTVSTGGSLAFKLSNSSAATTYFSINDAFPNYRGDFQLQPISSLSGDGTDFFNINRTGDGSGKATFQKAFTSMDSAHNYGYIEVSFLIVSNEADIYADNSGRWTRFVYIDPESVLADSLEIPGSSAADALRISITSAGNTGSETQTILLWNRKEGTEAAKEAHIAVNPHFNGGDRDNANNFSSHGKEVPDDQFEFDESIHAKNENIKPLDYYCGYNKNKETWEIDYTSPNPEERCLFSIAAGDTKTVVLRIWLEGQDRNCTDALAARQIDLKLIFDSYLYDNQEKKVVTEMTGE